MGCETRKKFEINLKVYIQTRSQLQEETQALQNLGQILLDVGNGAKDILSDLMLQKFDQIADTVIATGKAVNALTQWSVTERLVEVGISWFHLGDVQRQPFHLYFDISEAMEMFEIVQKIETVSAVALEKGVPVDHPRFEYLTEVMHPKLETISTGALVFFSSLILDLTEDQKVRVDQLPPENW